MSRYRRRLLEAIDVALIVVVIAVVCAIVIVVEALDGRR